MSKRKIIYHLDHGSVKATKLIKAAKERHKKLYKDFDHKALIDIIAYLCEQIESASKPVSDEYDLDDLKPENQELEYYLKRSEKPCLTRTEFLECREKFYSDFILNVELIKKNG